MGAAEEGGLRSASLPASFRLNIRSVIAMTIPKNHPQEPDIEAMARKAARQCRHVIQSCLREEEWRDADNEFHEIIRQAFLDLLQTNRSLKS